VLAQYGAKKERKVFQLCSKIGRQRHMKKAEKAGRRDAAPLPFPRTLHAASPRRVPASAGASAARRRGKRVKWRHASGGEEGGWRQKGDRSKKRFQNGCCCSGREDIATHGLSAAKPPPRWPREASEEGCRQTGMHSVVINIRAATSGSPPRLPPRNASSTAARREMRIARGSASPHPATGVRHREKSSSSAVRVTRR